MAEAPSETPSYQISNAINQDDRGLMITSITAVFFVASFLFTLLRLWVRWPWKALFGLDDACTCIAQAFCVAQTCAIFAAVRVGLGRKSVLLSGRAVSTIEKVGSTMIARSAIQLLLSGWPTISRAYTQHNEIESAVPAKPEIWPRQALARSRNVEVPEIWKEGEDVDGDEDPLKWESRN